MSVLGDMVVRIKGDVTDFNKAIDDSEKRFKASFSNFKKLGENLTKFVTLPIIGIGVAAVKAAADMEMQQAAFETLLGSAEKAKVLLGDLTDLAASTPFQLTDLAEGAKTMLAFGIANEKILPNLQMLGDIAGGNADKLKSLTLAFSQIQSTGRLMGQDLLQLINAGFNPLTIIAEKTGKSMAQLKKDMEAGAISADMVSDAFKTATSEGGLFFGGMERASKTFKGLVSTLVDNVVALGRSIGDILLPTLKNIVGTLSDWVKRFTALDEATRLQIIQYGLLVAAIGPLILAILKVIQIMPQLREGLKLLGAHPVILAMAALAAGIAVVAIQMKKAATEAQNFKDALSGAADLETTKRVLDAKLKEIEYQRTLIAQNDALGARGKQAADAAREGLVRLERELKLINDNYNGKLRNLKSAEEQAQKERDLIALEEKKAKALADSAAAAAAGDIKAKEAAEEQIDLITEQIDLLEKQRQGFADSATAQLDMEAQIHEAVKRGHQERLDMIEKEKQARIEAYRYMYGQISSIIDGLFANEIANIEASELSEEEKAKKIAQIKVKQAKWDKVQALVDIATNTATAITKALPNLVLAGIIGALGIAQAAVVAAQPLPPVPFADGGIVQARPGGIQATVAEAGVAEAIIPLDRFDRMLADMGATGGNSGTTHLVVNLDSRPLLDKIFDATKNRTVLISAGSVV
jgi:tape measure domain-containing protein